MWNKIETKPEKDCRVILTVEMNGVRRVIERCWFSTLTNNFYYIDGTAKTFHDMLKPIPWRLKIVAWMYSPNPYEE